MRVVRLVCAMSAGCGAAASATSTGILPGGGGDPQDGSDPGDVPDGGRPERGIEAGADAAPAGTCTEHCNDSSECSPMLPVADFECDLVTHRCVVCRSDASCMAKASGWILACSTANDCGSAGDVCIDVKGAGRCAFTTVACGGIFPDIITAAELGTSRPVDVCGVATSTCENGRCVDRCGPMNTCAPERGGRLCNAMTGRCECSDDAHCSGGVGVSKCNRTTRLCECAGDGDCTGIRNADVCIGGRCGCSNAGVCTPEFNGTSLYCE
jgi:hypothetical protein